MAKEQVNYRLVLEVGNVQRRRSRHRCAIS
jgi:hypothetical protein